MDLLTAAYRRAGIPPIHDLHGMFILTTAEILDDFVQTKMMLFNIFIADSPNFVNDFIVVHGRITPIKVPGACRFQDMHNQQSHKSIE